MPELDSTESYTPNALGNALGDMGSRIASYDWSATPLGAMDQWPPSLRAIVAFILHSTIPMVMLWGKQGTMIYNDSYAKFAADNHPRILGLPVGEAWPEVAWFDDNVMQVVLAGGNLTSKDQILHLTRKGTLEDVRMNLDYSPVYDDDGCPAGVLAIVTETTGAMQANKALRESEARLRFFDRLAKATMRSSDADSIMAITTRMAGEELGATICAYADMDPDQNGFSIRGDWTGSGARSIVGHYTLSAFGKQALEGLQRGAPLIINDVRAELPPEPAETFLAIGAQATLCMPLVKEGRLKALMAVHRDHPHRWTISELSMMREIADRSWAHIERIGTEVELRMTAQRLLELNEKLEQRAEERSSALQHSQTLFRLLVQGVTDYAIYMLDDEGYVTSWNAGAQRIKGYRPEEIIGQHFSAFYRPEDREHGDPERALLTARQVGHLAAEGWRVRKDGTHFRASVVVDAIHDDAGKLIGFAKITRDITEREHAQRELELAREALSQSQKMEAIGQLTGGVAHDFNNLLMAIHSSLELLRKRNPGDSQHMKLLDNALKATERGSALTQRMLAFARRQELANEHVEIQPLVSGMMELLQRSLGPMFQIDMRFPGDLPAAFADVNQLEMALLNLVVNARDAMPGGGTIRITAEERAVGPRDVPELAAGHYVRLTVRDRGSGMDAQTLARAADPFFTTKGVGKGTGLGLSMIHGFARQIGGTLHLESREGIGTDAHIYLPISQHPQPAESHDGETASTMLNHAQTVLAVDDDVIILMNTTALLEDLGHRVIEAHSGEEALQLMHDHPEIDLLITDQAMPGMTGSQLIEAIRRERPEMPIILATGYGETPSDQDLAFVRLGKPFNQMDLQQAIEALSV